MQQSHGRLSALLGDLDEDIDIRKWLPSSWYCLFSYPAVYYIIHGICDNLCCCFSDKTEVIMLLCSDYIYVHWSLHWVMHFIEEEQLLKHPKRWKLWLTLYLYMDNTLHKLYLVKFPVFFHIAIHIAMSVVFQYRAALIDWHFNTGCKSRPV